MTFTEGTFDQKTQQNINKWLEGPYDSKTKDEIKQLLAQNPQDLVDAFYTSLTFGTGGLRGIMGTGTNRINKYTISAASQGLANYLKKQSTNGTHSVFIGYDSRINSKLFAEETAKVLAGNGIRVYICKDIRPTPLVSYGCRYYKCSAAIVITASHNPPEYNGYKVYWNDGGQILPPHDKGIIGEVNLIQSDSMVIRVPGLNHSLINWIGEDLDRAYLEAISTYQLYPEINQKEGGHLNVIYTSLHGTGVTLIPSILKKWGFSSLALVDEQCVPDGEFPTVNSPNPEEGAALKLGIDKLKMTNADILIATDPDADRVGVVVNHNNEMYTLNGNQIACICLDQVCKALILKEKMPANAAFVKTIVTTELFKEICSFFHKPCFDVLTGFKYIAAKITEWEKDKKYQFIFGGEESFGYLLGTETRDKDAVSSAALICEVALDAKRRGETLVDYLNKLYERHGVFVEKLASIKFDETKVGREQMAKGLKAIKENPPNRISNIEVKSLENYINSTRRYAKTGEIEQLTLPKSDVLAFNLEDGSKITIRPSGTEPKIKIYCETKITHYLSIPEATKQGEQKINALLDDLKNYLYS